MQTRQDTQQVTQTTQQNRLNKNSIHFSHYSLYLVRMLQHMFLMHADQTTASFVPVHARDFEVFCQVVATSAVRGGRVAVVTSNKTVAATDSGGRCCDRDFPTVDDII